jgi:hypothetical protein
MKRDELIETLKNLKLDLAYADRWFVLCGDGNAQDHGATYVKFDEFGFYCTSLYPDTHDLEDCDCVTSWLVNEYCGSYADLINSLDVYVSTYTSGDLPSFTGFINTLIYTYVTDGLGHNDTQQTTDPHWLFNVDGSVPPLAFYLG